MRRVAIVGVVALLAAFGLSVVSRGQAKATAIQAPGTQAKGPGTQANGTRDERPGRGTEAPGARLEVPPPPFSDGIFPCTSATRGHAGQPHAPRALRHAHRHRAEARRPSTAGAWIVTTPTNRDQLHLASGEPVPFDESYRLCGQCHGEKYRDWRAGVHGRRVGEWNGAKQLPAVRALSQSAPAALQGAGAATGAGPPGGRK